MIKLVAVFFTLIAPGAGHVLSGHYTQGAVIGLLFAVGRSGLLPLVLRALNVQTERGLLQTFYAFNWFYIVLIWYAIIDSFLQTKSNAPLHFLQAIFCAACILVAYKNTFCKFIFEALSARRGAYELYLKIKKLPSEGK